MATTYAGIDVGSVAVAAAVVDEDGRALRMDWIKHAGEPEKALAALLSAYPLDAVRGWALTGSGARRLGLDARVLDPAVVQIEAVTRLVPGVRNILSIGGGSFSLTYLDGEGRFLRNTTNSACASGTGAFLDQQALRLGIAPEELGRTAARYEGLAPPVATRCAVFAKSDMIHLQQEGFPLEAVAKGLCNGLGMSTVDGLLGGRRIEGLTAVVGGVALNECVVAAVRERLGVETVVPARPECIEALGAALWAMAHGSPGRFDLAALERGGVAADPVHLRPPLVLQMSRYPDFVYEDYRVDARGNEVALLAPLEPGETLEVAMGLDIGSTSTKAVLTEPGGRTRAWCYRKTAGAPLDAVQHIFRAFRELAGRYGVALDIIGVGTTGSGRKMVGRVIGADLVMNEITAHARAAVAIDPEVDTIIELGGQDAKFTQLAGGVVYNSVMNYVCAAGTGSFIEEQAQKLGVPITDFAGLAMGLEAPVTSDRCTVYMERDLDCLLAEGWSKAQVAAAVLHSVRDNYLNKVVGGLAIGRRILFQGATARNRALVAAFEQRLERPITVSPLCHVTGALGMALAVLERIEGPTAFRGLDFADETITIENEICELCHNRCRLSLIGLEGEVVAWGLKCGRQYEDRRPVRRDLSSYTYLRERGRLFLDGRAAPAADARAGGRKAARGLRVGIPQALAFHGYLPLWRRFFEELDIEVVLSRPTSADTLARGEAAVTAEFCAPVLAGLGHAAELAARDDVDLVFLPHMIRETCPPGFTNCYFCCYVQAYPSVARSAIGDAKLLTPIVDFADRPALATALHAALRPHLRVTRRAVLGALDAGLAHMGDVAWRSRALGAAALEHLARDGGSGIVLIGRPYNTLDRGLNLDLPVRIAELGPVVLYQDMLPWDVTDIAGRHPNMYWNYGQRILAAARYVALHPALFPVYFTSFSCGPDSYVLTYFKDILAEAGKPYLVLQFDGHGADAGYLTRIEAALESFDAWRAQAAPRPREAVNA